MFDVPGYRVVRVLGTVYGLTVRSRNWAAGFGMVLKSIAGGELRWFTNMVSAIPLTCIVYIHKYMHVIYLSFCVHASSYPSKLKRGKKKISKQDWS